MTENNKAVISKLHFNFNFNISTSKVVSVLNFDIFVSFKNWSEREFKFQLVYWKFNNIQQSIIKQNQKNSLQIDWKLGNQNCRN